MATTTDLLTEIEGPVARITFNRPAQRNAASTVMLERMLEFVTEVAALPSVRCVVLTGAGEHFMAGGDVQAFSETLKHSPEQRRAQFAARIKGTAPLFVALAQLPQPLVARVRGAVAGAALGFVAGADFAICGSSALFILAHVNIGASPDGSSSYHLPRAIGVRRAKELAILGRKVDAQEALALGLVNQLVPDAELDAAVAALVQKIVAAPAESVRRAKLLMNQSLHNTLERQLQLEAECFAACAATPDFVEGVGAFMAKRPAQFNRTP